MISIRDWAKKRGYADNDIQYDNATKRIKIKGVDYGKPMIQRGVAYRTETNLDDIYYRQKRADAEQESETAKKNYESVLNKTYKPTEFKYDQNTDTAYKSAIETARRNIDEAQTRNLGDMARRGILNSSLTSDRANQISADEMRRVTTEVAPQLENNAYNRWKDTETMNYNTYKDGITNASNLYETSRSVTDKLLERQEKREADAREQAKFLSNLFGKYVKPSLNAANMDAQVKGSLTTYEQERKDTQNKNMQDYATKLTEMFGVNVPVLGSIEEMNSHVQKLKTITSEQFFETIRQFNQNYNLDERKVDEEVKQNKVTNDLNQAKFEQEKTQDLRAYQQNLITLYGVNVKLTDDTATMDAQVVGKTPLNMAEFELKKQEMSDIKAREERRIAVEEGRLNEEIKQNETTNELNQAKFDEEVSQNKITNELDQAKLDAERNRDLLSYQKSLIELYGVNVKLTNDTASMDAQVVGKTPLDKAEFDLKKQEMSDIKAREDARIKIEQQRANTDSQRANEEAAQNKAANQLNTDQLNETKRVNNAEIASNITQNKISQQNANTAALNAAGSGGGGGGGGGSSAKAPAKAPAKTPAKATGNFKSTPFVDDYASGKKLVDDFIKNLKSSGQVATLQTNAGKAKLIAIIHSLDLSIGDRLKFYQTHDLDRIAANTRNRLKQIQTDPKAFLATLAKTHTDNNEFLKQARMYGLYDLAVSGGK